MVRCVDHHVREMRAVHAGSKVAVGQLARDAAHASTAPRRGVHCRGRQRVVVQRRRCIIIVQRRAVIVRRRRVIIL
jgi:hypothetical protein